MMPVHPSGFVTSLHQNPQWHQITVPQLLPSTMRRCCCRAHLFLVIAGARVLSPSSTRRRHRQRARVGYLALGGRQLMGEYNNQPIVGFDVRGCDEEETWLGWYVWGGLSLVVWGGK